MKVLQLIDSLDAGGAERVAVTYANALCDYIGGSFLCATRKEGLLKQTISSKVGYLFLNKKRSLDFKAIIKLIGFVKNNNIEIIHAHSTSFFLASIVKLFCKNVSIIWHDHYGKAEEIKNRNYKLLQLCSSSFSAIISVNRLLEKWALEKLRSPKVYYLENIVSFTTVITEDVLQLKGVDGKRIICLANMRPQKDHENLINAFNIVAQKYSDYSLHLVGKNWQDFYFEKITDSIEKLKLNDKIHYYGSQIDISSLLKQCNIGVLSSKSEGLPLALLEYGLAKLAVVCTDVGQCKELVIPYGKCVPPNDYLKIAEGIIDYIENPNILVHHASAFKKEVIKNHSLDVIIPKLVAYYETCN